MERITVMQMPEVEFINQKHLERYVKFINSRPERDLIRNGSKYNVHHIIPRSLSGTDDKSNLIKLTHREHFIAHMILWKTYSAEMAYAFWIISNIYTLNARLYASLKKDINNLVSTSQKGRIVVNNGIKTLRCKPESIPYGFQLGHLYKVSDEHKQQYSDFFSQSKWITDGTKNLRININEETPINFYLGKTEHNKTTKRGDFSRKTIWINDGLTNKRFDNNKIIPHGWTHGMLKHPKQNKEKIWINNGSINKKIYSYDTIPEGWFIGLNKTKRFYINNGSIQKRIFINSPIPQGFIKGGLPKCRKK